MSELRVPRELMTYFRDNREIQRFFQRLEGLLSGTGNEGLADIEQRSTTAVGGKLNDLERRINTIETEIHRPQVNTNDLERKIDTLEKENR